MCFNGEYLKNGDKYTSTRLSRRLPLYPKQTKYPNFFPNSNKQDGGKKRVDYEKRPEPTREDRKINFDAYKIFYNTEVFKTEVLEVVSEVRKNVII